MAPLLPLGRRICGRAHPEAFIPLIKAVAVGQGFPASSLRKPGSDSPPIAPALLFTTWLTLLSHKSMEANGRSPSLRPIPLNRFTRREGAVHNSPLIDRPFRPTLEARKRREVPVVIGLEARLRPAAGEWVRSVAQSRLLWDQHGREPPQPPRQEKNYRKIPRARGRHLINSSSDPPIASAQIS